MCVVSWRGGAYLALGSEGATDEKSGLLSVAWNDLGTRLRIGSGRGSPPTYPAPSAGEPPVKGAAAPDPEGVDGRGGGASIVGSGVMRAREGPWGRCRSGATARVPQPPGFARATVRAPLGPGFAEPGDALERKLRRYSSASNHALRYLVDPSYVLK